jgi:hypothetical protein
MREIPLSDFGIRGGMAAIAPKRSINMMAKITSISSVHV